MAVTEDRRRITIRLVTLQVGAVVVFAALTIAFWFLQIVQNNKFEEMAENNHQRTLALRAPRGVLFDRQGKVLVENRHAYRISIDRERTKDMDRTIHLLSAVADLDPSDVKASVDRQRGEPSYRPIVVVEDASLAQVAAITARRLDFELPEVVVEEVPTRQYPTDALAAHLFGYVGQASDAQLGGGIQQGSIIGQSGVERVYNKLLMGEDGAKRVVVNSLGREIRTLDKVEPVEGRRVQLTIDYDLQKAAEDGFRHAGFNGAALIMDPRNGEVLTYVSLPAYDPNAFASGIDRATWASLNTDKLRPLQNRVIQGRYSPGSTFKIVVAVAGLEEGIIDDNYRTHCAGGAYFFGRFFKCHLKGGHGTVDVRHAMEKSCNVFFYTVGNHTRRGQDLQVGREARDDREDRHRPAERAGEHHPEQRMEAAPHRRTLVSRRNDFGVDRPGPGLGDAGVAGDDDFHGRQRRHAGDAASGARGGRRRRLAHGRARGGGGQGGVPARDALGAARRPVDGRQRVGHRWPRPHSRRDVAGKTGTAQVISNQGRQAARGTTDRDLRDHGFFVFFAPKDNPVIAGVIYGEHNEHGFLGAPDRQARHRDVLREAGRQAAAGADAEEFAAAAAGTGSRFAAGRAAGGGRRRAPRDGRSRAVITGLSVS